MTLKDIIKQQGFLAIRLDDPKEGIYYAGVDSKIEQFNDYKTGYFIDVSNLKYMLDINEQLDVKICTTTKYGQEKRYKCYFSQLGELICYKYIM